MADIKITQEALSELIASAVRSEVARLMTAKSPDERIAEEMARQRGTDRPLPKEELVPCVSPVTGARFTVRLVQSKTLGLRCVEPLDYQRPEGWNVHERDGGLATDAEMDRNETGEPTKKAGYALYKRYFLTDWNALRGKPLPDSWRAERPAAQPGSVTLTPDQLEKLGITAEQVKMAVGDEPEAA